MSALRLLAARRIQATAARTFVTSASHVSDDDPEVLEREKHRSLNKHPNQHAPHHHHAPGWNESLASVSEASVKVCFDFQGVRASKTYPTPSKADQSPVESPEELARVTVEYVKRTHSDDAGETIQKATATAFEAANRAVHQEAVYDKEEIEGPLGGKQQESVKVERDEVHGPLGSAGKR
ncbi:hypothetical protein FRC04_000361 [Tulasnella sp. 424]|nr:hypothetical protein FRC04_000361 [Tulasnella sp. 424]KAG8973319.1 hypothetical protein FRC05_008863 [Tulasnella sp. 425]